MTTEQLQILFDERDQAMAAEAEAHKETGLRHLALAEAVCEFLEKRPTLGGEPIYALLDDTLILVIGAEKGGLFVTTTPLDVIT